MTNHVQITDAAVQALVSALRPFSDMAGELFAKNYNNKDIVFSVNRTTEKGTKLTYGMNFEAFANAREAINSFDTAAIPHLPIGYEVKKLEWRDVDAVCAWCYAKSPFGEYSVTWSFNEVGQKLHYPDGTTKQFDGMGGTARDKAKAAAQADFERRVRECIIANPVDVEAVRRQAFEEAAQLAEKLDTVFDSKVGSHAAASIRALSGEPAQEEQWRIGIDRLPTLAEAQQAAMVLRACNGSDLGEWTNGIFPCDDMNYGLEALINTAPTSEAET